MFYNIVRYTTNTFGCCIIYCYGKVVVVQSVMKTVVIMVIGIGLSILEIEARDDYRKSKVQSNPLL